MRSLVLALLTLTAGCQLYFDDDDPPCKQYGAEPAIADNLLRDPNTGECQSFGYGECDDRCGPCPLYDTARTPNPDWGSCYSACEGLDADTCMGTAGCRAAYTIPLADDGPAEFRGCWAVAPSGPIQGGGCTGLDAHACSRHDDCIAYYEDARTRETQVAPVQFAECGPEPVVGGGCELVDCQAGYHCEQQCYPCDGTNGPCPPQCQTQCVPDQNLCAAADCGPGTECVVTCTNPPNGPSECNATCVPLTACEVLQTETACTSRSDCTPVYLGDDCTCYPDYCECNVLTYDRCETK